MSSDKSEEEEHEAVSRQIVDYYRKYSMNKHLPKYFSAGTSLSYMPPIVQDEEIMPRIRPTIVIDDTNAESLAQTQAGDLPEPKVVSPTSSIASNRKLEWDNGADIGYSNYQSNTKLFKSHSLPILLVDTKNADKSTATKLSTQVVTVISYPSGDDDYVDDKQIQSSSSSASYPPEAPIISSSSSVRTNVKPISTSSSSYTGTIAYLKSKIGTPDAESTPKFPSGVDIYTDTPSVPKTQKSKIKDRNRIITLCLTKPITVECLDKQKKKSSDKKIQTTFAEGLSNKCIQTSGSLERLPRLNKSESKPIENQSVILITYDSDSDKRICSSNVQTDADIASPCDSFEYYRQEKQNVASTDSSKDIPLLGQLITVNQSKTVIGDVDRSIELLQRLLKSKKYDPATKKRYVKKIVEKIVHSKYSEDSTTSSELFIPKKQNDVVHESVQKRPLQLSKFTVKTFSDEFLPGAGADVKCVDNREREEHSSGLTDPTGSSVEIQQTISSNSYQSWKDDKTTSEKLLEENQNGQGDHLAKFARKERQHQIGWINDEISHLTKLKGLLEKKVQTTTTVYMVSQHSDKSASTNSSTAHSKPRNYVIQTELSSGSSSSGVPKEYNLRERTGKKCYCVSELSNEEFVGDTKIVGDIEVVSGDQTTNIKVKTKKCGDKAAFRPKPPSLVGPGKYDTFPKSKAEEKCWPCGLQHRRPDRGSYTFEVPLNCNIADKVKQILYKYTKPSIDTFSKCECICTCPKSSRNTERVSCTKCCKCNFSSNKETQKTEDHKYPDNDKIQNTVCKTKCGCCQKQVQKTVCTNNATCCCCNCKKSTKHKEEVVKTHKKNSVCDQQAQTTTCTKDTKCCCRRCQGSRKDSAKSQTKVCVCNEQIQTTEDTKCCRGCQVSDNKREKTEDSKCQTKSCVCDQQNQTTEGTKCCRGCQASENKREKSKDSKCQTKSCVCNEQNQTTEDAKCCRGCQTSKNSREESEDVNCQTQPCDCDEQNQTAESTKCCRGCQANRREKSEECQTQSCGCDRKMQTTTDSRCCRGCQTSHKKEKSEDVKCQTKSCACDEQMQTTGHRKCCRGCQTSDDTKEKSENAKCQTTVCCCEEQIQTCNPTKDASCSCSDSDGNKREGVKCQTEACDCDPKGVQTDTHKKDACCTCRRSDNSTNNSDNGSSSEESSSASCASSVSSDSCASDSESLKSCRCCKRKNLTQKYLYCLQQKLNGQAHPLCRPCYQQNRMGTYAMNSYANATHVCNCYTAVQTSTLNEIKKTIDDLKACEDFCTCASPENGSNCDYCKSCQRKLKRTSKNKNGIAYLLTFENGSLRKEKKSKKPYLEEIKIKIPVGHKKKYKDKENKRKKKSYDSEATSSSGVRKNKTTTLQDYLSQNRPDFVQDAEGRRQTVNSSRTKREGMADHNKLAFLQKCQEEFENAKRLFSAKEMKEITQRNYRKLPEVQKKLNDNRDKKLRQASRLMADTFNKKLRQNVLQGRQDLPIDVQVVTM